MKTTNYILILLAGLEGANAAWADNLYVVENGRSRVGKYTTAGIVVTNSLISGLNNPGDIKLDGKGHVFVSNTGGATLGGVGMYTTGGAAVNASLVTGVSNSRGIAISGTNLYDIPLNSHAVNRYVLSGSQVTATNAGYISNDSLDYPFALVTDNTYVYLIDIGNSYLVGSIDKFTMAGGAVSVPLIGNIKNGEALTLDGTNIYATYNTSYVGKYSTSGAVINTNLFSAGSDYLTGIAADGRGHLFVADYTTGIVAEYSTNGTLLNPTLISGLSGPIGLAIENTGPTLSILKTNSTVFVSWTNDVNFALQTNSNLALSNWAVDTNYSTLNGTNVATFIAPKNNLFFRLESTNGP